MFFLSLVTSFLIVSLRSVLFFKLFPVAPSAGVGSSVVGASNVISGSTTSNSIVSGSAISNSKTSPSSSGKLLISKGVSISNFKFCISILISSLISPGSAPCFISCCLISLRSAFLSSLLEPSSLATLNALTCFLNILSCLFEICFALSGAEPFLILVKLYGLFNMVLP